MRFFPLSVLLMATLLGPVRPAGAQAPISLRGSPVQLAVSATLRSPASVAHEQPVLLVKDPYQHGTKHEGLALLIVGVAGIVTGLIIDEPVVTVLSAGVGGVGLYLYLR
jgi:hypothetical protein